MGWWRYPVVKETAEWPAGGQALLDTRAVGWMYSVGTVESVGNMGEGLLVG